MTSDPPTIPLEDPLIGARVGEYLVLEVIGEGGMGIVYRGLQPVIKKQVAIKVLKAISAADDPQGPRRLIAEAEAVNAIRHRGIIDIFSLGQLPDGRPYVVMEYLDGEPLDVTLLHTPRRSLREVLRLLIEICGPLDAAHRAGVVHRDLKPSNVFLCTQTDGSRYLKLLDFGLAKRVEGFGGSSQQSSQTVVSGTPDYMAPEQARGLPVSARTDIYALGVIAWELLGGHVPYRGLSPMDVMVAHVSKPIPALPEALGVPAPLSSLVVQMLAKFPEDRPASIAEVRTALEAIAERIPSSGELPLPRPTVPGPAPELPVRRLPRLALAGLGAASLAGLAIWLARPEPVPPVLGEEAALDAGPSFDAGQDAGLEDAGAPDAGALDAGAGPELPRVPAPPSARALLERISRLEQAARASANFDPSAMPFLQAMSRRLKADESPAMRRRVAGELDRWERQYLR